MNRSIRLRIALAVVSVIVTLVALQIVYVLGRYRHSLLDEIDDQLEDYVQDLTIVGSERLGEWVHQATVPHRGETIAFVEVLDEHGQVIRRSDNLAATGFPDPPRPGHAGAASYWDFVRPDGQHVRALDTTVGPWRVRVGASLEEMRRRYASLRRNLLTSLLIIALLGGLAAYIVAARALVPVARIAAQARTLGALPDGVLPRTGSGDEIDRLAAVLNDLLTRIRAEVLRVRQFIADAAHSLRTPLTAIRGHLELLASEVDRSSSEPLVTAIEQVDELTRFVNRLLLLEKLESGQGEALTRERFDLLKETRALVEHLLVVAEERGVSLECRGESVPVDADLAQVRQAILNLLDNALRATPRGGKVAVDVREAAGAAELAVSDTGPGLSDEQLERVFERFYSTRGGAGTGLGLPIARAIARSFGGDVSATSPGGARFLLRLPSAHDRPSVSIS
ncbi:MAG TPA: HAMP domain-containing sensor histidine kinase [Myxococcota bacterium]|nr:HAMP domain-containing sensor histidine kinase [Myxococcota bacterium]